ncbi:GNAT family N-acetyltransferase [Marinicauda algicola]|uniref:GNAT family N-acetyltransferase n=1 Tax=Marinicauda algicola TaxID=2029849 RepID=UPI00130526E8|nr:GNAT family N-acetyltransferase [Marinicauda algicola]
MRIPGIVLTDDSPPPASFSAFRAACGWGEISPELARQALERSLLACTAKDSDAEIVGFGRIVGDGLYLYMQDMIVSPAWRGRGIGDAIAKRLIERAEAGFPGARIMLMCAQGAEAFYERHGFTARPAPGFGPGMQRLR